MPLQERPKHRHFTPVLKTLHWIKIPNRIEYKAISLTYNTLQSSQRSYLRFYFFPRTFPPKVDQSVGGDNCYESNFYLSIALLSPIPTSIYTKNVFHQNIKIRVLINVVIMQCAALCATFSLNRQEFFHQSSFYLRNFVHQNRGKVRG